MPYTINELCERFDKHAKEFAAFLEKNRQENPLINQDNEKDFNLPAALYVITSEIKKLKDKYGTD